MATLTATKLRTKKRREQKPLYDGKKMSLEKFLDFKAEDGFKYEWNNGFLEAREKMIKAAEFYLVNNLQRAFLNTSAFKQGSALLTESVCPISEGKYRVPDLAVFTKEQIERAKEGEQPVPIFVIELVSESDRMSYYDEKLDEYFSAGVQCVWLILPMRKKVSVFTSPKEVKICTDDDICSAAPAIPDFQISVNQIFGN
ncbi:MAG: Uma2 family endonuclease [Chloroherpetonaceae bacterium]|nr:Uma2 family endonuclease [Chloroherpetonaceae bacterium]MCS7212154.1 Uma2 family endonuclease [Chloroherpetonaceae bacterium]MDW8019601.1 Uma2 family endonuclease [Chloroherpetonaceae bacterium]